MLELQWYRRTRQSSQALQRLQGAPLLLSILPEGALERCPQAPVQQTL